MSTPELQKHDNGRYYIHWTKDRRSIRRSTGTSDLAQAQKVLGAFLMSEVSDDRRPTDARATVQEIWERYVEEHADVRNLAAVRNVSVGRHLIQGLGAIPIAGLRQAQVDKYVRDRVAGRIGKKASLSTVWLELNKLVTAINFSVKKRYINANDKPEIELPEPPEPRDRWLTQGEAQKLFAAAESLRDGPRLSRLERFLWIALQTAARKERIETLTWDRVDFEAGVIHYRKKGDRNTNKKRPSVPISGALRPILERAYAERVNDLVLDTIRPINRDVDRAGALARVEGVTPNVLRHTAATWMARRGVPLWKIAGVLGNSMMMVEKVYAKHSPEGLADAVDTIGFCAQTA